jgi:transcriptional regulator with XRE-family HTH domain
MIEPANHSLGPVLKAARDRADLQQRDLADRTGIQMSRISRIENGRAQPTREEIMSLLHAIGTEDSLRLVHDIDQPLTHVNAPTWLELSAEDKEALRQADKALGLLIEFKSRKSFRSIMESHVEYLRGRLESSTSYLINTDHTQ